MAGITKKVKEKVKGAKDKVIDTKDKAKHIASDTKDKVTVRSIKENISSSSNRSVEKASRDDNFITNAVNSIKEMQFPAYKKDIVEYAKKKTGTNSDITLLFESLNGYVEFKDPYHVQKALEETNPEKKKANQISD